MLAAGTAGPGHDQDRGGGANHQLDALRQLVKLDPGNPKYLGDLSSTINNIGVTDVDDGCRFQRRAEVGPRRQVGRGRIEIAQAGPESCAQG
mgnify:CR=1 FL=1